MKILYPWAKPERRILLWQNPPAAVPALLRKARAPRPRSSFDKLIDYLATAEGRSRFCNLIRDLANDVRVRRVPRIVGVGR